MKPLNGYRPTHRNKWLLVREGILSVQQLSFLEFCADNFDFDQDHKTFGQLEIDLNEVATNFRNSPSTIRGWRDKLLKLGFIQRTERCNVFLLACPKRYVTPGRWRGEASHYAKMEKDQSIETILRNFGINLQPVVKNDAGIAKKPDSIALGSSKDEFKVRKETVVIKQGIRSDEEYRRIQKRGGFPNLTLEDMRWIDENVKEEVELEKAPSVRFD